MAVASNSAQWEIVAKFENLRAARRAIMALGLAGVGAESISLGGAAATEAQEQLATDAADVRILVHILKYIVGGAVVGTILGAAVSPLAGWIVLALLGAEVTIRGLLVALFLTTLMSHMIGGFIGYTVAMQGGQSWELSFQSTMKKEVLLHVRTTDAEAIARAREVIRRYDVHQV